MKTFFGARIYLLVTVTALLIGCSQLGFSNVQSPPVGGEDWKASVSYQPIHNLWAYFQVYADASAKEFEIVPAREITGHWNVLKFLEQGPCTDCVSIAGIAPSGSGTLLIDVEIRHPFDSMDLTGFDVRGICMFNGSHSFPFAGLNTSVKTAGEGELVNADGFTALYNSTTAGAGPGGLKGYIAGKMASLAAPSSTLNGYKRYISPTPGNTRNIFDADTSIIRTFELNMPDGPSEFGYAVDACWAFPLSTPVTDPASQFPQKANCPEPWLIEIEDEPIGDGLTTEGGETKLKMRVYDYGGKDTHASPLIECPDLWNGLQVASWVSDETDPVPHAYYEATISNINSAPAGRYKCLVSVEDNQNATAPDWLDLTAYHIQTLSVINAQPEEHELWYMERNNLLVDAQLNEAIARLEQAAIAGYDKVLLSDFKIGTIDIQSDTYHQHVQTYISASWVFSTTRRFAAGRI